MSGDSSDAYASPHPDVPATPVEAVIVRWQALGRAKTLPDQASALVGLSNAMSDLRSWTVFRDYDPTTARADSGQTP